MVLPVLGVIGATVGVSLAFAHGSGDNVTVKTFERVSMVPNKYIQDGVHFVPGTVSVASGGTLTFEYGNKDQEPHTLTVVPKSGLPRTAAQVENCAACQKYATPHLKNPKAPPDQHNPIVHWTLDKAQPGFDSVGDSLAIQPGAHKKISVEVTAPPGTTLYFLCAVHPWMQGKIVVK
jgi:plastocyanin